MLQYMFYFLGTIFFFVANSLLAVSIFVYIKDQHKKNKRNNLRFDIANLLARIADPEQRKRATEVFSTAKTIEDLQKIKSRLVEILVTSPKKGAHNV